MGEAKRKDEVGPVAVATPGWTIPTLTNKVTFGVLAAVIIIFNLPMIHYFIFRPQAPTSASIPFSDDFSKASTIEENYFSTGGLWRVVNGELLSPGVKNNPLWLKASLPANVAVEFDTRSMSPEGDIKMEIFGNGTDHASGYVLIHGGWDNKISIIARLDEHAPSWQSLQAEAQHRGGTDLVQTGVITERSRVRVEAAPYPVQLGRTYHWRIERRERVLTWFIDRQKFMEFDDPFPLSGKGHDRFGFSSWEAQLFFDNLKIEPL